MKEVLLVAFALVVCALGLWRDFKREQEMKALKKAIAKEREDNKRLKGVADEADRIIAHGGSVDGLREHGWLRE
ncbi:hypothetical protein DC081_09030 [Ignatzschineria cameli]|nr:hypothetical protein DC081_09030 [Ignatzschineria cameli]